MTFLIKNAYIVNEGEIRLADIYIEKERIHTISPNLHKIADKVLDARGMYVLPGLIDDQVHFREPGLTHKGDLYSESRAAIAGGITSYMEMPNTSPQTIDQERLEAKYRRAADVSFANYSFYLGATNDNLEEILRTDPATVCGIKIFMGSSTGNMLVDMEESLDAIFRNTPMLIAVHCEKEEIVQANLASWRSKVGDDMLDAGMHPYIRSREACYASTVQAIRLAQKHGSRLHVLHISTEEELSLFEPALTPLGKRITAEACIHHLWFSEEDYEVLGNKIKWNPAIKSASDRKAIQAAVREGRIDVIATDHAPHTQEEKSLPYLQAPSGGPLVQHALLAMWELFQNGVFTLPQIVEKMCHHPAVCYGIQERGYIREGYYADLVIVDPGKALNVSRENILYKCAWSPFEGHTFPASVHSTLVNGQLVYHAGIIDEKPRGKRLTFVVPG